MHGGAGGVLGTLLLGDGEQITHVTVRAGDGIEGLIFTTSLGQVKGFGNVNGGIIFFRS